MPITPKMGPYSMPIHNPRSSVDFSLLTWLLTGLAEMSRGADRGNIPRVRECNGDIGARSSLSALFGRTHEHDFRR